MKKEKQRISYGAYAYLKSLVDADVKRIEQEYYTSCRFIPSESPNPKKESGIAKASKILSKEVSLRNKFLEELTTSVREMYKDHPNKAMRDFWGIKC